MQLTRRFLLGAMAFTPLAMVRGEEPDASTNCYDPATLPGRERSMRRSLGFKEVSDSEEKRCETCAFFIRKQGDCGTCQLLVGGQTTAQSVCNSWAPKETA